MRILTEGTYYGIKKTEIQSNGILLSEYDYNAPRTDWHFHENPYFMYVLQGDVYDVNRKSKKTCPPGSLIFHNWQEAHYNTKETSYARGFHIEFRRKWFEDKQLDIALWEGSDLVKHPMAHHLLAKIYFEFRFQDAISPLSIELLMLQFCEGIQKHQFPEEKRPSWTKTLQELLQTDLAPMHLEGLSNYLGIHPVHLSRAFPKYFDCSLGDYLRKQKIQRALPYLFEGNFSLTEIANICHFSDQSHFTRTFKAYLGQTPSAFQKHIR
ncbi:MAG: helix-turn-helix transcriptional regulator [Bacteroidota bacterium]